MATNKELGAKVKELQKELTKRDEITKIKDKEILELKKQVEDTQKQIPVKEMKITKLDNGTVRADA